MTEFTASSLIDSSLSEADNALLSLASAPNPKRVMIEAVLKLSLANSASFSNFTRHHVWSILLSCHKDTNDMDTSDVEVKFDAPNQRTITVDAERTRQTEIGDTGRVLRLLTFYCKHHRPQKYKQGLNETLAPFILLSDSCVGIKQSAFPNLSVRNSDRFILSMFGNFMESFLYRFYEDEGEMLTLQLSLRFYDALLFYFDPQLRTFLDQYNVISELYASQWLLSGFARGAPKEVVYYIWDVLISTKSSPGPIVLLMLIVSLVISSRQTILNTPTRGTSAAELPSVMSRLGQQLKTVADARRICGLALQLLANVPLSFRNLINTVCFGFHTHGRSSRSAEMEATPALLQKLERLIALPLGVGEVLLGSGSKFAIPSIASPIQRNPALLALQRLPSLNEPAIQDGAGLALLRHDDIWSMPPHYTIIDCRSADERELGGFLPTSFHIDPERLQNADELEESLRSLMALKGEHIAILGSGDVSELYYPSMPPDAAFTDANGRDSPLPIDEDNVDIDSARNSNTRNVAKKRPVATILAELDLQQWGAALFYDHGAKSITDDKASTLAAMLLQRGLPHVSIIEGGFTALHQHQAHFINKILLNHDPTYCQVCTGGRASALYHAKRALDRGELLHMPSPVIPAKARAAIRAGASKMSDIAGGIARSGAQLLSPVSSVGSDGQSPNGIVTSPLGGMLVGEGSAAEIAALEKQCDKIDGMSMSRGRFFSANIPEPNGQRKGKLVQFIGSGFK